MSVLCGSQGCHVCRVCGLSGSVMVVPGSTGLHALIVDLCWMWTATTCLSAVCGSCPRPLPQLESPASRSDGDCQRDAAACAGRSLCWTVLLAGP